jgi:ubiquinone/menaquinone biosynthesis C-methylase UbiE
VRRGRFLAWAQGVVDHWQVIGVDIQQDRVQIARHKYHARGGRYLRARGESIPLANASVNGVFCEVAFPYMHIPRALAELHRVLAPGGLAESDLAPAQLYLGRTEDLLSQPQADLVSCPRVVEWNGLALLWRLDFGGQDGGGLPDGHRYPDGAAACGIHGSESAPWRFKILH